MRRLAIQIFVAAVFLTTIISATTPNPRCSESYDCENRHQTCISTIQVPKSSSPGDCFDDRSSGKITNDAFASPFGHHQKKGKTIYYQAHLSQCNYIEQQKCSSCCIDTIIHNPGDEDDIGGEVRGKICLCKIFKE